MSKTVPLKNAVQVIKSAEKLPATLPKREYADFDAFVANTDKVTTVFARVWEDEQRLCEIEFEWLQWPDSRSLDLKEARAQIERAKMKVQLARYTLREFPQARKRFAQCKRDVKWYDRKELYEVKGKGKREKWTLSRRVVSEEIGLLLASFQNARPGTPEAFGKMMIEEVYANGPNACVLESACRQVRREKDFPPSIAEVLKAIDKESSAWCDRWTTLIEADIDQTQREFEETIARAEAKIVAAEAEFAEREAREKAAEEKRKAYYEAYERIPRDEQRAFEEGRRMRSDAYRYKGQPMPPMPSYWQGKERETQAYEAGLAGEEIPGLELKTNRAADGV
jgi:hypothetical protein